MYIEVISCTFSTETCRVIIVSLTFRKNTHSQPKKNIKFSHILEKEQLTLSYPFKLTLAKTKTESIVSYTNNNE